MSETIADRVTRSFFGALETASVSQSPYHHWYLTDLFPEDVVSSLAALEFPTGNLKGVSGSREVHNDTRHYFDQENIQRFETISAVAQAFQSAPMAARITDFFGADIDGALLRLEYAQDIDGFWLQPHTDIGVKQFTLLIYLSDGPDHDMLGTDIYADKATWAKRTPFAPNMAIAFVPNDHTWHGFEKRPIKGVRKSLIMNYVTTDWRDREQLAFPQTPVRIR